MTGSTEAVRNPEEAPTWPGIREGFLAEEILDSEFPVQILLGRT